MDIDLSDKVTDHPHYGQPPELKFHDPSLPMSKKCLYPGCGRNVHEHRAQSLPPTKEAYDMMLGGIEAAKGERRASKEKEARYEFENDELMKGPHGVADHTVKGKGWSEKGPSNVRELRRHIMEDHQVDRDDLKYMPHLARSHSLWHQQGDDEDHTHR